MCGICLEVPTTFGLLSDCSHIFCLDCLRTWRDRDGKNEDMLYSRVNKKCPYCRTASKFVTPSSLFYPTGHPGKAAAVERYKASMARIKCKYFLESKPNDRFCPFGRDCLYQHQNDDGTPYVFKHGTDYYMPRWSRASGGANTSESAGPDGFFQNALDRFLSGSLHDMNIYIEDIRAMLNRPPDSEDRQEGLSNGSSSRVEWIPMPSRTGRSHTIDNLADDIVRNLSQIPNAMEDLLTSPNALSTTASVTRAEASPNANADAAPTTSTTLSSSSHPFVPDVPLRSFDLNYQPSSRPSSSLSTANSMPDLETVLDSDSESDGDDAEYSDLEDEPNVPYPDFHIASDMYFARRVAGAFSETLESVHEHADTRVDSAGADEASSSAVEHPPRTGTPPMPAVPSDPPLSSTIAEQDSTPSIPTSEETPASPMSSEELPAPDGPAQSAEPASSSPAPDVLFGPELPVPRQDAEPPFMTDGRGRVVWSRTGAKSGGAGARGRRAEGTEDMERIE
ncbi:hypothetical protein EWM64_g5196 [Hericium alpestre]|uniref:Uncharacterized protein n=1 Tax=Hericium alpestre TaxID=135208 RepID=A0A4Y9ZW75_9AGAM|nr:hypothetical protein EWM64_g5196 [Hericium alpestre]